MKTHLLLAIVFFTSMFCNAQWSFTDLTESRFRMGVTSLGSKVFFAGGELSNGEQSSAIEVYDIASDDWDTVLNLVFPRSHITCVSCGTKVFFAGGADLGTFTFYDIVEIWDTESGQWTFEQLLAPRFGMSAVSYGNKVMFAGGANFMVGDYNFVEIYNVETDTWDTTHLSVPRAGMSSAIVGDLAFFAGGSDLYDNIFNRVDIYNFTTGTWSIDSLSEPRTFTAAAAVGPKVLFAGGTTPENESSSRVDIYNAESGTWEETAELSQPRAFWEYNAGSQCDQFACFAGGGIFDLNTNIYGSPYNTIDIYNQYTTPEWSIDTTYAPVYMHSVIGIEDHLLIAGGVTDVDVSSRVQIMDDCYGVGVPESSVVSR
ncbi:MAG: hypothetical protein MUC31_02265, partial [Bacteroidales bacterium]|nr:hypothetical protein [Bacteroidales bacterium]